MLAVEKSHISGGACVVRRSDIRDEQSQTRRQNREKVRHKTGRQMSTGSVLCATNIQTHTLTIQHKRIYESVYFPLFSSLSLSVRV